MPPREAGGLIANLHLSLLSNIQASFPTSITGNPGEPTGQADQGGK